MSFWDNKKQKDCYKNFLFIIHSLKNHVLGLKTIDLLHELSFYHEFSTEKISKAFKRYARSYKKILYFKQKLIKSIFKVLFKDLLYETKGFKYQITVKFWLSKLKENGDIEFAPVYFNYTAKTVINSDK